jgi:hypothetical protein
LVHVAGVGFVVIKTAPPAKIAGPTTSAFRQTIYRSAPIIIQPIDTAGRDIPQTQLFQANKPMAGIDVTTHRNAYHPFADSAAVMAPLPMVNFSQRKQEMRKRNPVNVSLPDPGE